MGSLRGSTEHDSSEERLSPGLQEGLPEVPARCECWIGRFGGGLRARKDPMQLNDDDIWAIAIGMDLTGIERNFLIYANRRGFTIRSRTKGTHSTLKELNENNVREQIAFIYRINISAR
jgi:hypothetical protein